METFPCQIYTKIPTLNIVFANIYLQIKGCEGCDLPIILLSQFNDRYKIKTQIPLCFENCKNIIRMRIGCHIFQNFLNQVKKKLVDGTANATNGKKVIRKTDTHTHSYTAHSQTQ